MNVVPPGDIRNLYDCSFSDERFTKRNFPISFQFRRPILRWTCDWKLDRTALTEMRGNIFDAIRLLKAV